MKTYGVVINMDYAHHPVTTCKDLWNIIAEKMLVDDFRIEKRMFMITTHQAKESVYEKARNIVESIDKDLSADKNKVYHYLKDFFTVDMTDHIDLRFPDPEQGMELQEEVVEEIILN
jgi:hypothetical protein